MSIVHHDGASHLRVLGNGWRSDEDYRTRTTRRTRLVVVLIERTAAPQARVTPDTGVSRLACRKLP